MVGGLSSKNRGGYAAHNKRKRGSFFGGDGSGDCSGGTLAMGSWWRCSGGGLTVAALSSDVVVDVEVDINVTWLNDGTIAVASTCAEAVAR